MNDLLNVLLKTKRQLEKDRLRALITFAANTNCGIFPDDYAPKNTMAVMVSREIWNAISNEVEQMQKEGRKDE